MTSAVQHRPYKQSESEHRHHHGHHQQHHERRHPHHLHLPHHGLCQCLLCRQAWACRRLPDAAELQHPYADRKPNEEVAENADLDVASSVRRPAGAGRLFKKPTPESTLRP